MQGKHIESDHNDIEKINLFIGSSAVNTFSLSRDPTIRIRKFKGATAKGLGLCNDNSKSIMHLIQSKYEHCNLNAVVWMFGTVDCKFTYYYRICCSKNTNHELDHLLANPHCVMEDCAEKYIDFIKTASGFLKDAKKDVIMIVMGVEPNSTPPELVYDQCLKYEIFADTACNKNLVTMSTTQYHPERLRRAFNRRLYRLCQAHGFKFLQVDDEIIKSKVGSKTESIVQDRFRDPYPLCVHLNWEEMVQIYVRALKKKCGLSLEMHTLDLEYTRKEYIEDKSKRPAKRIKNQHIPRMLRGVDSEYP